VFSAQGPAKALQRPGEFVTLDDQWRRDLQHVPSPTRGGDQQALCTAQFADPSGAVGVGRVRGRVLNDLDAEHQAKAADAAYVGTAVEPVMQR